MLSHLKLRKQDPTLFISKAENARCKVSADPKPGKDASSEEGPSAEEVSGVQDSEQMEGLLCSTASQVFTGISVHTKVFDCTDGMSGMISHGAMQSDF